MNMNDFLFCGMIIYAILQIFVVCRLMCYLKIQKEIMFDLYLFIITILI